MTNECPKNGRGTLKKLNNNKQSINEPKTSKCRRNNKKNAG